MKTEEIDKKWFSQEIIAREIYYLGQNSKDNYNNKFAYEDYVNWQIKTG